MLRMRGAGRFALDAPSDTIAVTLAASSSLHLKTCCGILCRIGYKEACYGVLLMLRVAERPVVACFAMLGVMDRLRPAQIKVRTARCTQSCAGIACCRNVQMLHELWWGPGGAEWLLLLLAQWP